MNALKQYFSEGEVDYNIPTAGMFMWLTFKALSMDSFELFRILSEHDVITVPGSDFFVAGVEPNNDKLTHLNADSSEHPTIRITYAASSPQQIDLAIKNMANAIHSIMSKESL